MSRERPLPRLIVTDLDGTFLSSDGTVSEQNAPRQGCQQPASRSSSQPGPVRWLEVIRDLPAAIRR
jgi:hypothetical protein